MADTSKTEGKKPIEGFNIATSLSGHRRCGIEFGMAYQFFPITAFTAEQIELLKQDALLSVVAATQSEGAV